MDAPLAPGEDIDEGMCLSATLADRAGSPFDQTVCAELKARVR